MKVKLFLEDHIYSLEYLMNSFLKNKEDDDIKKIYTAMSNTVVDGQKSISLFGLIAYKEGNEKF